MSYQKITEQLLSIIQEGERIIGKIILYNEIIKQQPDKKEKYIQEIIATQEDWYVKCKVLLSDNGLLLEREEFINFQGLPLSFQEFDKKLSDVLNFMRNRKALLVSFAKDIESKRKKEVVLLKIDDFTNFSKVRDISANTIVAYAKDCFLEDDIENTFLEKLEEPYKEPDAGAETRDLFTDKLDYNNKRLSAVFMFKGRGEKGELTIEKCGAKGNQLLKLAKNGAAECFIVQHTNKINPDVREALLDHVLQHSKYSTVYLCFIDGVDTARFLKSMGKDLEQLKNKK